MDNYVGKRLDGRYEIQEIVGVGEMSVVYKAYDNVDDRIVAVKLLNDEFLENDEFSRRLKNESIAIALLSHPNIVKVYDVSFGEKLQYIVMEYVDGITLKEYIQKQGAITWNDALFFTTQILTALQHAHDKGIVHRDIKPQNIILLSTGSIKVADFGIARFSRSETKTLTDTAIGSVHYISPEQAKGEFTDERADIYSVGVVLYEMLAGKVPFEADSAVSVALMQLQDDAKKLTDINPDIPKGLEQICIHAMQKNPSDRYQTATEMLLDVEEVIKNKDNSLSFKEFKRKSPFKIFKKLRTKNTDNTKKQSHEIDKFPKNQKKMQPYSGKKSYVFISYAHKDKKEVYPVIDKLLNDGFRVWYDDGIDPGTEWDENIAKHIEECGYFIPFISENYLKSSNCKDELNFARDLDKDRFLIYLENVNLPSGMNMRLSRLQNIHKYVYSSFDEFYNKLLSAKGIDNFK